jgi:hypothetical protein
MVASAKMDVALDGARLQSQLGANDRIIYVVKNLQ